MNTVLILILLAAAAANIVLLVALLLRSSSNQTFANDVREDLRVGREELRSSNKEANDSVAGGIRAFTEMGITVDSRVKDLQDGTEAKLEATRGVLERIREIFDTRVEELRQSLDARVKEMQEGNERKLEEMRQTVDEKLQGTLEKRLGESFKFVSDRLEMVHKGLGEMQGLATGVGDLKRIFSNVKVRGTWAEVQLGGILEQMLTPDQWAKNVCVKEGSLERVECAIRLPGPKDDRGQCMWLPIDSKFPTEDYARLQSAAEAGDPVAVQAATDCVAARAQGGGQGHPRQVCESAGDDRLRHHVLGDRGTLCRGAAPAAVRRGAAAEIPGGHCGSDHALGDREQPADGVSDPGGRAAGGRGVAGVGGGEDGVWEVRRSTGSRCSGSCIR